MRSAEDLRVIGFRFPLADDGEGRSVKHCIALSEPQYWGQGPDPRELREGWQ